MATIAGLLHIASKVEGTKIVKESLVLICSGTFLLQNVGAIHYKKIKSLIFTNLTITMLPKK